MLRRLHEQLKGQPISIIVTDPTGLVLSRRTGDANLERHLDTVRLAPGFSYAEEFAGTNGIGTALEAGTATHVFGHEHYAENLEDLACAGVPLHHPISGRTVGAVDLTCWRSDAGGLLLALAKATADQIQQALLVDSAPHELEVFQAYRRTCRRVTGIVFALANDAVMLNDHARATLDPLDQAALLVQATQVDEATGTGRRAPIALRLPTGVEARMYCEHVRVGDHLAGIVVHVKLGEPDRLQLPVREVTARMPLPGLVGHAPLWLRACHEVESAFLAREWLAVEGEPGVGKLALLRSVQVRGRPGGRFAVLDASEAASDPQWVTTARRTILEQADSLVIRHVDALDPPRVRTIASALREVTAAERGPSALGRRSLSSTPMPITMISSGCCARSRARLRCPRCGCTSKTSTSWYLLPWSAQSRWSSQLLTGGDAVADALELAGQCHPAVQAAGPGRATSPVGVIEPDRPASRGPVGQSAVAQPARINGTGRDREESVGRPGQQGQGGAVAGNVARDDLPQDPRVRHSRLTLPEPAGGAASI